MTVSDGEIMEEYRRRMMAQHSSTLSCVRAIAQKFGLGERTVRSVITKMSPKRVTDSVKYRLAKSDYPGMRKVIVQINDMEVIWHTTANDQKIEDKIRQLKNRRSVDA